MAPITESRQCEGMDISLGSARFHEPINAVCDYGQLERRLYGVQ